MTKSVYRERTTLRLLLLSAAVGAVGLMFLVLSSSWKPISGSPEIQVVVRDIGSLFLVSVGVGLLWELIGRRAFVNELLSVTELAEDIEETGLASASSKWHGEIDWNDLFDSSDELEILFAYGRTWRNTYRPYIEEFADRDGTKARIALPDYEDEIIIAELSRRFEKSEDDLISRIREAETDFIEIFSVQGAEENKLEIWRISLAPVWSYYRFDNLSIFTLYKHRRGRSGVPTFTAKKGGSIYEFLEAEFRSLVSGNDGLGRRIYPAG